MVDRLNPNDNLANIGQIESSNGASTLVLQGDGNVVLYRSSGVARWATSTNNAVSAIMQADGNFVLYSASHTAVWASNTAGHPGAFLVLQDDGNLVIYDSKGAALWASNTVIVRQDVPGFLPSTSGFHFPNSFDHVPDLTIDVLGNKVGIGDANNGLCGGMVFAVRDYFEAGIPIPQQNFSPSSGPLFDYIVKRLFDSFDLLLPPPPLPPVPGLFITPIPPFGPGPLTYMHLMDPALPDHETVASQAGLAYRGRAWVMIIDSWPRIKTDIDTHHLSPIGMIEIKDSDPTKMGQNHQVIVYGYSLDGTDLTLRLYDPNAPDNDTVTMSLNIGHPEHTTAVTNTAAKMVWCFFRPAYTFSSPPARGLSGGDLALTGGTGWATIPVAFSNGNGTFTVTNNNVGDFASWAATPGVQVLTGDFNGDMRTDIALVRQQAGWATIPVAFSTGNGFFTVTNSNVGDFASWATTPGARVLAGDFNGNMRTDIALAGGAGWATIPVAFSNGDGTFTITNNNAPDFASWAATPGVQALAGDFNGNGRTDIALVRQQAGWATIPVAFSNGDGTFTITNSNAPDFASWATTPGARVLAGDFNSDGRTDIALAGGAGWATIPVAFSNGNGTFTVTNNNAANFAGWAQGPTVTPLIANLG
jgi:VCBS repeat protein